MIGAVISAIMAVFKNHKLKIFISLVSFVVSALLLFPFGDLSLLATGKVAEFTQNQVFLQFDDLKLNFLPKPEVEFEKIAVALPGLPSLSADQLHVSPSPTMIFTKNIAGSMSVRGIFRGDVDVVVGKGTNSEGGTPRQKIEISADKLNLQELKDIRQIPLLLKGQLSIKGLVQSDLAIAEQPEAEVEIRAEKFEIPAQVLNTIQGPFPIPDLKLGSIEFKGKLVGGRLTIESGKIGKEGDDIRGTIQGGIAMVIRNQKGLITELGQYTFDVDLTLKKSVEDKLSSTLILLDGFKTPVQGGSRYQIRLAARNINLPPEMGPVR